MTRRRSAGLYASFALVVALAAFSPLAAHAQQPDTTAPKRLAIRAARLIDGKGGAPITNAVILIEGERITAVGSGLAIPRDARVIDLGPATVLPGFIDSHTHVTSQPRKRSRMKRLLQAIQSNCVAQISRVKKDSRRC